MPLIDGFEAYMASVQKSADSESPTRPQRQIHPSTPVLDTTPARGELTSHPPRKHALSPPDESELEETPEDGAINDTFYKISQELQQITNMAVIHSRSTSNSSANPSSDNGDESTTTSRGETPDTSLVLSDGSGVNKDEQAAPENEPPNGSDPMVTVLFRQPRLVNPGEPEVKSPLEAARHDARTARHISAAKTRTIVTQEQEIHDLQRLAENITHDLQVADNGWHIAANNEAVIQISYNELLWDHALLGGQHDALNDRFARLQHDFDAMADESTRLFDSHEKKANLLKATISSSADSTRSRESEKTRKSDTMILCVV
jgi:hypothetical protein